MEQIEEQITKELPSDEDDSTKQITIQWWWPLIGFLVLLSELWSDDEETHIELTYSSYGKALYHGLWLAGIMKMIYAGFDLLFAAYL